MPNFIENALYGLEAGQKYRQQGERRKAFAGLADNPEGSLNALAANGDYEGYSTLSTIEAQRRAQKARQAASTSLAAGDVPGAERAALSGGDDQLLALVNRMSDRQKASALESSTTIATIGQGLHGLPYEARKAALRAMGPDLAKRGIDPQALAGFDPTDENIQAAVASVMSLKDVLERDKPINVAPGGRLVTPGGKEIYAAPEKTQYYPVAPGGKLFAVGGDGSNALASPSGPPAAAAPDVHGVVRSMIGSGVVKMTRGFDTPAHNRQVRGVDGSHHLEGTPTEPGAYDLTPAKGQSLDDIAGQLRQSGVPDRYILVERTAGPHSTGPHVHVTAPTGVAASAAATPRQALAGARLVAEGAPKPGFRRLTPQEAQAAGYAAGSIVQRNDETGQESVVQPPPKQANTKFSPQDANYLNKAKTSAQELTQLSNDAKRFVALNRQVSTGPGRDFLTGGGKLAGLDPIHGDQLTEMKSIQDKITPAMRNGLPGAASDRDVEMFRSATVSIGKTGPANQSIANAVVAASKRQQDYVGFLENWARENGSLLGAQEEWNNYATANPMFATAKDGSLQVQRTQPWRQWFGVAGPSPVTANRAPPAAARRPATVPAQAPIVIDINGKRIR